MLSYSNKLSEKFRYIQRDVLRKAPFIPDKLPPWTSIKFINDFYVETIEAENLRRKVTPPLACELPILQPFGQDIMHIFYEDLKPLQCENEQFPLVFNSSVEPYPRLFPVKSVPEIRATHGIASCCMRRINGFVGGSGSGNVDYGKKCLPLSLEKETKVAMDWDFLVIECEFLWTREQKGEILVAGAGGKTRRRVDVHSFIRPGELRNGSKRRTKTITPNVLVLGIDSVSRLSFRRTFPETHDFLVKNLAAVEFKGYHKVGVNTFPNTGAMLTNKQAIYTKNTLNSDMKFGCEGPNLTYDSCPFLWNDFKAAGYQTFYGDDSGSRDQFYEYRGGFIKPPTDFFLKPFTTAAAQSMGHDEMGKLTLVGRCFGPRSAFQVLMDILKKVVTKMEEEKSRYFSFIWSDISTHGWVNGGRQVASDIVLTLNYLKSKGYLNETILIVLSDHGSHMHQIGYHYQGYLEARLPFMYFVVPTWFQTMHPKAYQNLKRNAAERLAVPFDIYETLVDLLPQNIENFETRSRQFNGPGRSLFSLIPSSRTCETAGIRKEFCACNLKHTRMSTDSPMLIQAAKKIVKNINSLLVDVPNHKCKSLTLNTPLISAEAFLNSRTNMTGFYRVVFETVPGKGSFEAMINVNTSEEIIYGS